MSTCCLYVAPITSGGCPRRAGLFSARHGSPRKLHFQETQRLPRGIGPIASHHVDDRSTGKLGDKLENQGQLLLYHCADFAPRWLNCSGTSTSLRVHLPGAPGAPGIQMNAPAIYHNALPPSITPSSSPGTLSACTLYDCWQSIKFPFFRPTNGTITCTLPL